MKIITVCLLIVCVCAGCAVRGGAKSQFDFANRLAQEELWKEALYRWEKLLEIGKASASVYNNIAVAMEAMGRFDEAQAAYQKAMGLAPGNSTIKANYEKLKKSLRGENGDTENGDAKKGDRDRPEDDENDDEYGRKKGKRR